MSTAVNANINLSLIGLETGATVLGNQIQYPIQFPSLVSAVLTNGSGAANKINQAVFYSATLASNSNTTLNFNTLGTTDPVGGTVNINVVKGLYIINQGVTIGSPIETDTLTVEPGASNPWLALLGTGSTLVLNGGACFFALDTGSSGWAINSSTAMNVKLVSGASNSGTINFQIIILGTT